MVLSFSEQPGRACRLTQQDMRSMTTERQMVPPLCPVLHCALTRLPQCSMLRPAAGDHAHLQRCSALSRSHCTSPLAPLLLEARSAGFCALSRRPSRCPALLHTM